MNTIVLFDVLLHYTLPILFIELLVRCKFNIIRCSFRYNNIKVYAVKVNFLYLINIHIMLYFEQNAMLYYIIIIIILNGKVLTFPIVFEQDKVIFILLNININIILYYCSLQYCFNNINLYNTATRSLSDVFYPKKCGHDIDHKTVPPQRRAWICNPEHTDSAPRTTDNHSPA